MVLTDAKLDLWLKNNLNVLIRGRHGVGKTTRVIDAFERAGLNWLYYSGATMDTWVDMIGIPKEKVDPDSGKSFLELIRPKVFEFDQVEAIFIDEFNRAPKKVRNSVLELIQFKSINGKKLENLRVVWTAVNPDDDDNMEYDVEPLDPAQEDRFHIHTEIPYKPDEEFFTKRFGHANARAAIEWWKGLPEAEQRKVSPRRLEYALTARELGITLRDVLKDSTGVNKLVQSLKEGPLQDRLDDFLNRGARKEAESFLVDQNNLQHVEPLILNQKKYKEFFLPLMSPERISALMSQESRLVEYVLKNSDYHKRFEDLICDTMETSATGDLSKKIRDLLNKKHPDFGKNVRKRLLANKAIYFAASPTKSVKSLTAAVRNRTYNVVQGPAASQKKQTKLEIYKLLEENLPETMLTTAAWSLLEDMTEIVADYSRSSTCKSDLPKMPAMMNHCLSVLMTNEHKSTADMHSEWKNRTSTSHYNKIKKFYPMEILWY